MVGRDNINSFRLHIKVFLRDQSLGEYIKIIFFVCKRSAYYKTCISVNLDDGVYTCKRGSTIYYAVFFQVILYFADNGILILLF